MSRCFPFPPPGYESKSDDVNLIIKEKQKQKKPKDKKDKDKKERSDRKEKERSEGTKEDKNRKRKKHRDKKDKKKDKQSSLEEEKIIGSLENQNVEKLVPDSKPTDGIQDKRTFVELGKRFSNGGGAMDNQMVQKITLVEKRKANLLGKVQENSDGMLAEAYDDIKDKREHSRMANGQSLKVDARSLENGLVGNYGGENQINVEGGSCQVDKFDKRKEGKEGNGYGNIVCDRNKNTKAKDKKRKKEKKKEKVKGASKEKIKQGASDGNFLDFHANKPSDLLKVSRVCQGKLPKHKELNGFLHDNGIRPNNISRPALSSHQAGQNGSGFCPPQNIINLAVEKGAVITNQKVNGKFSSPQPVSQTTNNSAANHGRVSNKNLVLSNGLISSRLVHVERKTEPCQTTNSVAKVKQIVNNCSADEKIPSSHPFLENGGKMAMQGPDAVRKMDNKELRMNGSIEGKKYTSSRPVKPPHPDLKYLSQILTVPKVEWPQCDDQEWLFGCKNSQTKRKRPKLASSEIQWTKQVWAEAIQVESADITVMPYVIPY